LLEYGMMNQAGFSVICGDTGAGKTTLIRRLLNELGNDTTVGLITNTHQSFGELLNWVLMAFGLDGEGKSKAQMHQQFLEFLIEQYAHNQHTILIVDEAQNMSSDTLEELRMLSNINADKDQVLQVILAGQPALRETLRRPELMQFAQRIAVDYYLEALDKMETCEYIQHRLEIAGSDHEIFTQDACEAIYKFSGGVPRLINLLCDTAMVYGYADQAAVIGPRIIHDVVREQHANSIVPTFNRQEVNPAAETVAAKAESSVPAQEHIDKLGERLHRAQTISAEQASTRTPVNEHEQATAAQSPVNETQDNNQPESTHTQTHVDEPSSLNDVEPDPRQEQYAEFHGHAAAEDKPAQVHSDAHHRETPISDDEPEDAAAQSAFEETEEAFVKQRQDGGRRYDTDEIYPIIEVKNDARKGLNYLVLGLTIGILMASLVLVIVGYYVFKNQQPAVAAQNTQMQKEESALLDMQRMKEMEKTRLEAMQRERDAALAITHALERERDAALATAKAQEELREADRRAAELVRQQEKKSAIEVQRAQEKAHQAEIAAARAKEKERLANEQVRQAMEEKQRLAELERKARDEAAAAAQAKLSASSNAMQTGATDAAPETSMASRAVQPAVVADPPPVAEHKPSVNHEDNKPVKFSANPCNSPSAKFLSTCKK